MVEKIQNVEQFVSQILGRNVRNNKLISYRGHGNKSFKLRPSIFRSAENRENEHILLRELVAAHPEDFSSDVSALEMLVLMQNYSLPTRILDVSFNPLVALYFACEPAKRRNPIVKDGKIVFRTVEADGEVIIFEILKTKIKYFDSDTVKLLSNLSRLNYALKEDIDTSLDDTTFNGSLPVRRLVHFIRQENSAFQSEIVPNHLDKILMVKPKQNNKRILAQSGAFFVFGLTEEIKENNEMEIGIDRMIIDAEKKKEIRSQIDKFSINEKTLFPEIERAARYIVGQLSDII